MCMSFGFDFRYNCYNFAFNFNAIYVLLLLFFAFVCISPLVKLYVFMLLYFISLFSDCLGGVSI